MEAVNGPVMLMEIERELAGPQKEAALAKYDAVLSATTPCFPPWRKESTRRCRPACRRTSFPRWRR